MYSARQLIAVDFSTGLQEFCGFADDAEEITGKAI
jgi:hypothetical protein